MTHQDDGAREIPKKKWFICSFCSYKWEGYKKPEHCPECKIISSGIAQIVPTPTSGAPTPVALGTRYRCQACPYDSWAEGAAKPTIMAQAWICPYCKRNHEYEPQPVALAVAPAPEAIDHPSHYGGADNPYEAIRVIRAWGLDFSLGNAIKYIARAGRKPGSPAVQDLEKAKWYLNEAIEHLRTYQPLAPARPAPTPSSTAPSAFGFADPTLPALKPR